MKRDSWSLAAGLVEEYVRRPARLSHLLERLPGDLEPGRRRACQSLLFGVVRHLRLLERALDGFLRKRPRLPVWAILLVASRELMESPEASAKIVHHAVNEIGERFSKAEKGLANAVLRKVPDRLRALQAEPAESPEDLAWRFSHPLWRVRRWVEQFGLEETRKLLEWNQEDPELFGWLVGDVESSSFSFLEETTWPGFFRLAKSAWEELQPLLEEGRFYVQNPAAGIAPCLLAEGFSGGRVLDLCAAPGGKSLLLRRLLGDRLDRLVSVDLAGPRFERMRANFQRCGMDRLQPLAGDLRDLDPVELGLFEAVLLDAPCSNSGVLQRKVDARWRMDESGLAALRVLQNQLLASASALVKPGGILVYSTCSVDRDENEDVVAAFLRSESGRDYLLETETLCLPWRENRDGAGVAVLRRLRKLSATSS